MRREVRLIPRITGVTSTSVFYLSQGRSSHYAGLSTKDLVPRAAPAGLESESYIARVPHILVRGTFNFASVPQG